MAKEQYVTETRPPFRKYENGYEAYLIDRHPHGKIYRDPHNPSGIVALPQESIMLVNSLWVVVMFLETIEDLNRIEKEMNLKICARNPRGLQPRE